MALDFPANPTGGQVYGSYIYNATVGAWQGREDSRTVAVVSTDPPTSANPGDIWYDSDDGTTYLYYSDGTSSQWVELLSSGLPLLNTKADLSGATFSGNVTAPKFISNVATGTSPLTVASTTVVANLNADLLDGQHASVYSPAGMVTQYAGLTAPSGWLLCDGSAVSRTTYASLFAAISTTYGAGDGSTTFALPNLQGRVPVGKNSATFTTLGGTGGAETVTLTVAQMPSHTHVQDSHNHTQNSHGHTGGDYGHSHTLNQAPYDGTGNNTPPGVNPVSYYNNSGTNTGYASIYVNSTTATNQATTAVNQNTGGGAAHNNLQPYIVMNYIIKV